MSYLGQGLGLGREERFTATATAGQTTVTVGDDGRSISYTPNYVDVYLNGSKQVNGSDITVTSGTSIVFASALTAGDVVDVVAPGYFQPADTVSRSLGGTFLGAVNLPSGGLNVGSGQLKVDTSGRVTANAQPCFSAYHSADIAWNAIGSPIQFNGTRFNIGGHYNTSTYKFTAPVGGKYLATAYVHYMSDAAYTFEFLRLQVNSTNVGIELMRQGTKSGYDVFGGTHILTMAAGDTLQVIHGSSGIDAGSLRGSSDFNTFEAYLLG